MTVTCKAFIGFETGGHEESEAVGFAPTVDAVVAPASAKETYSASYGWKRQTRTRAYTLGAGWITSTIYVRFGNVSPDNDAVFAWVEDNIGFCWKLEFVAFPPAGNIFLQDANGNDIGVSFATLAADTWYRIQVKWKHGGSDAIRVWLDDVLKINKTGQDLTSGGTTGTLNVYNPIDPRFEADFGFRASHLSMLNDDGTLITDDLTAPRDLCVKAYQNTTQGLAPDVGDSFDIAHPWSDAGNTPGNDATDGRYTLPLNTTKQGYVYCDDGARTGPSGDGDLTDGGQIMGMSGTWRVANGVAVFNGVTNMSGLLGKDDGPTTGEHNYGLIPAGTTKINHHAVVDVSAAACPTTADFLAIGVKGVKAGFGVPARLDVFDIWGCILYQEKMSPRYACIDGLVTDVS